jgi:hypothetical protein
VDGWDERDNRIPSEGLFEPVHRRERRGIIHEIMHSYCQIVLSRWEMACTDPVPPRCAGDTTLHFFHTMAQFQECKPEKLNCP